MWGAAGDLAAALEGAVQDLGRALSGAAPGWLALGVLLHLANQVLRGRGWYAIVRAATPGARGVGRGDAVAAWIAGAGAGGILSARGGDALRIVLLRRRVGRDGCPLLAGTLVAEGVGEALGGAVLLAVALALGVGPALSLPGAGALWALAAVAAAAIGAAVAIRRVAALRRLAGRVGRGCALLRSPGAYARDVLPWQLASRGCRVAAMACFLLAFGLPAAPAAVLLVLCAQGGGRLLPFAPAAVGAATAMLAAAFQPVTGVAVPAGEVAAFFVGTSTALTVVGTSLTVAICVRRLGAGAVLEVLRTSRRPAGA